MYFLLPLKSWMQGTVDSVCGKAIQPRGLYHVGISPMRKSSESIATSSPSGFRNQKAFPGLPLPTETRSVFVCEPERVCGGATSGTTVSPIIRSPAPVPDTMTLRTAVSTVEVG